MSALNSSSQRRLNQLQQMPSSVWEGDRRPLSGFTDSSDEDAQASGECIIWVDGVEGVVRSMEVVAPETGKEAVVRALLRAMEHPHSPAKPARPEKIVVRDKEIQFYLRGVLQNLGISIDYASELPLIDELFRGFDEMANGRPPKLPPKYANLLVAKAYELWNLAPWEVLADHEIVTIELNQWDVGTLYISVMGMMGMEYGILLYRSSDSIKRFRASILAQDSFEQMEEAFLGQDCFFVTYERIDEDDEDDDDDDDIDLADLPASEIQPNFGTIHPLEGMRPFLYDEEALTVYVALEALRRFIQGSKRQLEVENIPEISKNFNINLPQDAGEKRNIPVKMATLPALTAELFEIAQLAEDEESDTAEMSVQLREDLVPKDSFISFDVMPWERVELLRSSVEFYQSQNVTEAGEGLPVIVVQTSRPKAKVMIEQIQNSGGLKGICFNPGEDPLEGELYDLGIFQTEDGSMFMFGEFMKDEPLHKAARKKWDQRCKKTQGYCGLLIAKGLTGASRGKPQAGDMMALLEARSLSVQELGLGLLQLMPNFDFE